MARTLIYRPDPVYRYIVTWGDEYSAGQRTFGSLYGAMIHADQLSFMGAVGVEVFMEENVDGV